MSKKIISVLLAVVMVLAMGTVALVSVSADLADLPEVAEDCYRYYFYLPEDWKNDYAYTAGIYWWEGTGAHAAWPGQEADPADHEGVYYCDVPQDVTTIIWNNFLDGGTDRTLPIYQAAIQTVNIGSEYYDAGESDNYPEGTDSFDGMIYVTDNEKIDINPFSGKMTVGGEWYYYYGNGEYGFTPVRGDGEIFTDDVTNKDVTRPTESPTDPSVSGATGTTDTEPTETTAEATTAEVTTAEVTTAEVTTAEVTTTVTTTAEASEVTPGVQYDTIITAGGKTYGANIGDTVTYTMDVQAARLFENIQALVTYDSTMLNVVRHTSDDPDVEDWEVEGPIACPNLDGVIFNAGVDGVVKMNASKVSGYNFKEEKNLVTLQFNVVAAGETSIDSIIEEMTIKGGDESYFANGQQVITDGISITEALDAEPYNPTVEPSTTKTEPTETTAKTEPTETTAKTEPTETTAKTEPTETTAKTEPTETTAKTEPTETTAKTEPTTAKPEPTTAKPEPTTAKPEPTTAKPEPTTAKAEPTTAKGEVTTATGDATTVTASADASAATGTTGNAGGTSNTGAATYIYVAIAVLTMAAFAVVVLRKRANG